MAAGLILTAPLVSRALREMLEAAIARAERERAERDRMARGEVAIDCAPCRCVECCAREDGGSGR